MSISLLAPLDSKSQRALCNIVMLCRGVDSILNPGGWQQCERQNLPTLVRIGLTDLPNSGGRGGHAPSPLQLHLCCYVQKPYGKIHTRSHVTNATLFGTMQWMNVLHTVIVFGYLNSKNVLGYILMYLGTHLLITKWNLFGVGHQLATIVNANFLCPEIQNTGESC